MSFHNKLTEKLFFYKIVYTQLKFPSILDDFLTVNKRKEREKERKKITLCKAESLPHYLNVFYDHRFQRI